MTILVLGGAGYIGSVTVERLLERGHRVIVFDNLSKGHRGAVPDGATLVVGDLGDADALRDVFSRHTIDAVMHFAALSLVGESVKEPARYFENNVAKALVLLDTMREYGVRRLVFSSTAAVYGEPTQWPINEDAAQRPTNPYGESKLAFEKILKWYEQAYGLRYVCLRYFNAAGATACAGEDHHPETHLIPLVLQVALGQRDAISVYGDDYPTPDGTCVRDYIHVLDLAEAHILALSILDTRSATYNLGNGSGFSVRQVIDSVQRVTGRAIPVTIAERRAGDPAVLVASSARIREELKWSPVFTNLDDIIRDAWRWHQAHPRGYETPVRPEEPCV